MDLPRIAATLKAHDPDVVCLQEVAIDQPGLPGRPEGDQPLALASMFAGYEAVYCAGSDLTDGQGGRRQFGELILSRLPVLQVFRHRLPWPADPAVPSMQRVALETVVTAPAGPLRLITTHLEFYSQRQRCAQVESLRDVYAEGWAHARQPRSSADADPPFAVLPRGAATIVCGDFNFPPGAPEWARMQDHFAADAGDAPPRLCDAWPLLNPGVPHPPTAGLVPNEFMPAPTCFDFFFVSENLSRYLHRIAVDAASEASDHQPVMLELKF